MTDSSGEATTPLPSKSVLDEVIEQRRYFHKYPEVGARRAPRRRWTRSRGARDRTARQDGDAPCRHRRAAHPGAVRSRLSFQHRRPDARVRARRAHGDHDRCRSHADRPRRRPQRPLRVRLPAGGRDRRRRQGDDREGVARQAPPRRCHRTAHRELPAVRHRHLEARPDVVGIGRVRRQLFWTGRPRRDDGPPRQRACGAGVFHRATAHRG